MAQEAKPHQGPYAIARTGTSITPSDVTELGYVARYIHVGVGGDLEVITVEDDTLVYKNLPSGVRFDSVHVKQVKAANTTATDLIGHE